MYNSVTARTIALGYGRQSTTMTVPAAVRVRVPFPAAHGTAWFLTILATTKDAGTMCTTFVLRPTTCAAKGTS